MSITETNNNIYSNSNLLSVSSGGVTNGYTYSKDRLDSINANGGTQYKFEYDKFGRTVSEKICPEEIENQSIRINADIKTVINKIIFI